MKGTVNRRIIPGSTVVCSPLLSFTHPFPPSIRVADPVSPANVVRRGTGGGTTGRKRRPEVSEARVNRRKERPYVSYSRMDNVKGMSDKGHHKC